MIPARPGDTPRLEEAIHRNPQRSAHPDWPQFWPGDAPTDLATEDLLRDVLARLEGESVHDQLEGYKSESQGQ